MPSVSLFMHCAEHCKIQFLKINFLHYLLHRPLLIPTHMFNCTVIPTWVFQASGPRGSGTPQVMAPSKQHLILDIHHHNETYIYILSIIKS